MRLASYRLTHMAFEMAREAGACFSVVNFMSYITVAKRPCYGPLKIPIFWRPADNNECHFGYHCRQRASDY
jgi:hypothetical protein